MGSHPQYMVQLDALRAFAVLAVMFAHFYQGEAAEGLPWGAWGVRLFFVLSGFLITGILLRGRDRKDATGRAAPTLQQFYIRRSLRIFPLFYLVILVTALLNIHPMRETIVWHLTYTSNIYFAMRGSWNGAISHLWSLAVEEQFYLVWPWLILFAPHKYLAPGIGAAILLALLYQIGGHLLGLSSLAIFVSTITYLEFLGMGALLAYARQRQPQQYAMLQHHPAYRWVGLLLLLATLALATLGAGRFYLSVLHGVAASLFFTWLIHAASLGLSGVLGKLLEAPPVRFLGKISYGLYLYHNFMPPIVGDVLSYLHLPWPASALLRFIVLVTATTVVAACSWRWFERPINELRRRFEYVA